MKNKYINLKEKFDSLFDKHQNLLKVVKKMELKIRNSKKIKKY